MTDKSGAAMGPSLSPRKEDGLFGPGEEMQTNACIAKWEADWIYSNGFRLAALHLANQVCESGQEQDMLIYPIVYLYRHHVELVLKVIIRSASRLLDRKPSEREAKVLGQHSLVDLWQAARPLLNPVCARASNPTFPDEDLEGVDSYIRQIHEHDPDGQRFRYATRKAKRDDRPGSIVPSLSPDLRLVNIRVLAVAMEKLAEYLEGIENWFSDLEDAKSECERTYRR
jgi:hypothetical protein